MLCVKCNKEIPNDGLFCPYCGRKQIAERSRRTRGNGAGSVYRRGKTWMAALTIGRELRAGKSVPIRVTKGGFVKKADALAYLPNLAQKSKSPSKNITFLQVYDAWEPVHAQSITKDTLNCYRAAKKHYADIFYLRFSDVGLDDLQACVDDCPRGRRTRENMKALGTLLYKYALPRHLSDMDYAAFINCGANDKTRRAPFTLEEVEIVRKAIGIVPYAEYIYCLFYTGFRPGEMLRLTKDSYDPKENVLIGGLKTEAGIDRPIPISMKIAPIIRQLALRANPFLFPREDGKQMGADYFRENCFYPALEKMGLQPVPAVGERPRLVPYSCRHTFADLLKGVQGSDTDKAALMGHTSAEMTKYYQTADYASLKSIIRQI